MAETPRAYGFTKPTALILKGMAHPTPNELIAPFVQPGGNAVGAWLMEALTDITAAVDATTAGSGEAAVAKRDADGATAAELVSHANQEVSTTVYNLGPEILQGDFFQATRDLAGTIWVTPRATAKHGKTSGTITARSGATPGTGNVNLMSDDLATTGTAVTAKSVFGQTIASGTYCVVLQLGSGDWTIIAADCP